MTQQHARKIKEFCFLFNFKRELFIFKFFYYIFIFNFESLDQIVVNLVEKKETQKRERERRRAGTCFMIKKETQQAT